MQKLNDEFFNKVNQIVPLKALSVLEVGCGEGRRSFELAPLCKEFVGIDPDPASVAKAQELRLPNAAFHIGSAEKLPFANESFDAVFFTKSLHHVPADAMGGGIDEAIRVVGPAGYIIFLEEADAGTFYDAAQFFAADIGIGCAGTMACAAIAAHPHLVILREWTDEVAFHFDSVDDFKDLFGPNKNLSEVKSFLDKNDYLLHDIRRTFITRPV